MFLWMCLVYEIKESAPYFPAWLWAFRAKVQLRLMGEEVCKEVEGRNNERGGERWGGKEGVDRRIAGVG